ncbi:fluoride efflux transporter FluC [Marinicrinis lubricantis]|uniref:Fluoride-specific ion channel FluC n=1 Tax=Marinicrinis lubricantis TaxID=2086470 RepID=A0ABW1IQJ7_9BACL
MMSIIAVALGGSAGAVSRFLVTAAVSKRFSKRFPYGTLTVNLLGSFLLGWLSAALSSGSSWLLFAGTGFMGAFTTFSTLNVEFLKLMLERRWNALTIYFISTFGLGIAFGFLGYAAGT